MIALTILTASVAFFGMADSGKSMSQHPPMLSHCSVLLWLFSDSQSKRIKKQTAKNDLKHPYVDMHFIARCGGLHA